MMPVACVAGFVAASPFWILSGALLAFFGCPHQLAVG
jgi:hypothetical protein